MRATGAAAMDMEVEAMVFKYGVLGSVSCVCDNGGVGVVSRLFETFRRKVLTTRHSQNLKRSLSTWANQGAGKCGGDYRQRGARGRARCSKEGGTWRNEISCPSGSGTLVPFGFRKEEAHLYR